MTDKGQIICKYKFQDKEKFNGKPYCTCFSELCEDLSFVCDHNCQIYEDYKQLIYRTQEIEEIEKIIEPYQEPIELDSLSLSSAIASILERKTQECEDLRQMYKCMTELCEAKAEELMDKRAEIDELERECERLKKNADANPNSRLRLRNEIRDLQAVSVKRKEILEEIEEYCIKDISLVGDLPFRTTASDILDIINKAKEKRMNDNKLDRIIGVLIEDLDPKELWHIVFNKMTNAAKRQMIGEMLNTMLGSGYTTEGNIFRKE